MKKYEMKSKKDLIEKWESVIETAEFYGKGKEERLISYMKDFVSDLNQLDEPEILPKELPVIPEYVADWIWVTKHRKNLDLYPALKKLEDRPAAWKPWERIYEWYRMNTHQFVNAYLTGEYEVGEEQKYYIMDKDNRLLLYQFRYGEDKQPIEVVGNFTIEEVKQQNRTTPEITLSDYQFTEQEIKDYDERYWPFAIPVELAE